MLLSIENYSPSECDSAANFSSLPHQLASKLASFQQSFDSSPVSFSEDFHPDFKRPKLDSSFDERDPSMQRYCTPPGSEGYPESDMIGCEAMLGNDVSGEIVHTDHPQIFCTKLPSHYRTNKSLPSTFAVFIQDASICDGTQVMVSAGNSDNPNPDMRNNSALVCGTVPGLGKVAKFSDLRFVGRSGRGKYFSVTITVLGDVKLVGHYHKAIKVTVDGPRSSRKVAGSGAGGTSQAPASGSRGVNRLSSRRRNFSGGVGGSDCISDASTSSDFSDSRSSSICQSPDLTAPFPKQAALPPAPLTGGLAPAPSALPEPTFTPNLDISSKTHDQSSFGGSLQSNYLFQPISNFADIEAKPEVSEHSATDSSYSLFSNAPNNSAHTYLPQIHTLQPSGGLRAPIFHETSVTTKFYSYHTPQGGVSSGPPPPLAAHASANYPNAFCPPYPQQSSTLSHTVAYPGNPYFYSDKNFLPQMSNQIEYTQKTRIPGYYPPPQNSFFAQPGQEGLSDNLRFKTSPLDHPFTESECPISQSPESNFYMSNNNDLLPDLGCEATSCLQAEFSSLEADAGSMLPGPMTQLTSDQELPNLGVDANQIATSSSNFLWRPY